MDDLTLHSRSEKELDPLIQTVRIFNKDIGILVMKKGNILKTVCIELPDVKVSHYKMVKII